MLVARQLHQGMHGGDVLALQHALIKAGFRKHPPSRHFGRRARKNVIRFQKHHGLKPDGVVGPKTWARLHHLLNPYDKYLIRTTYRRRKLRRKRREAASLRDRAVRVAYYYLLHRELVHYVQQRPMVEFKVVPPDLNNYCDCSEFVTTDYHAAGAPDPNGFGYNGIGNTSTLVAHGQVVSRVRAGDLLFYDNPAHVAISVGNGRAISHGSEGGPYLVSENYRTVTHRRSYLP